MPKQTRQDVILNFVLKTTGEGELKKTEEAVARMGKQIDKAFAGHSQDTSQFDALQRLIKASKGTENALLKSEGKKSDALKEQVRLTERLVELRKEITRKVTKSETEYPVLETFPALDQALATKMREALKTQKQSTEATKDDAKAKKDSAKASEALAAAENKRPRKPRQRRARTTDASESPPETISRLVGTAPADVVRLQEIRKAQKQAERQERQELEAEQKAINSEREKGLSLLEREQQALALTRAERKAIPKRSQTAVDPEFRLQLLEREVGLAKQLETAEEDLFRAKYLTNALDTDPRKTQEQEAQAAAYEEQAAQLVESTRVMLDTTRAQVDNSKAKKANAEQTERLARAEEQVTRARARQRDDVGFTGQDRAKLSASEERRLVQERVARQRQLGIQPYPTRTTEDKRDFAANVVDEVLLSSRLLELEAQINKQKKVIAAILKKRKTGGPDQVGTDEYIADTAKMEAAAAKITELEADIQPSRLAMETAAERRDFLARSVERQKAADEERAKNLALADSIEQVVGKEKQRESFTSKDILRAASATEGRPAGKGLRDTGKFFTKNFGVVEAEDSVKTLDAMLLKIYQAAAALRETAGKTDEQEAKLKKLLAVYRELFQLKTDALGKTVALTGEDTKQGAPAEASLNTEIMRRLEGRARATEDLTKATTELSMAEKQAASQRGIDEMRARQLAQQEPQRVVDEVAARRKAGTTEQTGDDAVKEETAAIEANTAAKQEAVQASEALSAAEEKELKKLTRLIDKGDGDWDQELRRGELQWRKDHAGEVKQETAAVEENTAAKKENAQASITSEDVAQVAIHDLHPDRQAGAEKAYQIVKDTYGVFADETPVKTVTLLLDKISKLPEQITRSAENWQGFADLQSATFKISGVSASAWRDDLDTLRFRRTLSAGGLNEREVLPSLLLDPANRDIADANDAFHSVMPLIRRYNEQVAAQEAATRQETAAVEENTAAKQENAAVEQQAEAKPKKSRKKKAEEVKEETAAVEENTAAAVENAAVEQQAAVVTPPPSTAAPVGVQPVTPPAPPPVAPPPVAPPSRSEIARKRVLDETIGAYNQLRVNGDTTAEELAAGLDKVIQKWMRLNEVAREQADLTLVQKRGDDALTPAFVPQQGAEPTFSVEAVDRASKSRREQAQYENELAQALLSGVTVEEMFSDAAEQSAMALDDQTDATISLGEATSKVVAGEAKKTEAVKATTAALDDELEAARLLAEDAGGGTPPVVPPTTAGGPTPPASGGISLDELLKRLEISGKLIDEIKRRADNAAVAIAGISNSGKVNLRDMEQLARAAKDGIPVDEFMAAAGSAEEFINILNGSGEVFDALGEDGERLLQLITEIGAKWNVFTTDEETGELFPNPDATVSQIRSAWREVSKVAGDSLKTIATDQERTLRAVRDAGGALSPEDEAALKLAQDKLTAQQLYEANQRVINELEGNSLDIALAHVKAAESELRARGATQDEIEGNLRAQERISQQLFEQQKRKDEGIIERGVRPSVPRFAQFAFFPVGSAFQNIGFKPGADFGFLLADIAGVIDNFNVMGGTLRDVASDITQAKGVVGEFGKSLSISLQGAAARAGIQLTSFGSAMALIGTIAVPIGAAFVALSLVMQEQEKQQKKAAERAKQYNEAIKRQVDEFSQLEGGQLDSKRLEESQLRLNTLNEIVARLQLAKEQAELANIALTAPASTGIRPQVDLDAAAQVIRDLTGRDIDPTNLEEVQRVLNELTAGYEEQKIEAEGVTTQLEFAAGATNTLAGALFEARGEANKFAEALLGFSDLTTDELEVQLAGLRFQLSNAYDLRNTVQPLDAQEQARNAGYQARADAGEVLSPAQQVDAAALQSRQTRREAYQNNIDTLREQIDGLMAMRRLGLTAENDFLRDERDAAELRLSIYRMTSDELNQALQDAWRDFSDLSRSIAEAQAAGAPRAVIEELESQQNELARSMGVYASAVGNTATAANDAAAAIEEAAGVISGAFAMTTPELEQNILDAQNTMSRLLAQMAVTPAGDTFDRLQDEYNTAQANNQLLQSLLGSTTVAANDFAAQQVLNAQTLADAYTMTTEEINDKIAGLTIDRQLAADTMNTATNPQIVSEANQAFYEADAAIRVLTGSTGHWAVVLNDLEAEANRAFSAQSDIAGMTSDAIRQRREDIGIEIAQQQVLQRTYGRGTKEYELAQDAIDELSEEMSDLNKVAASGAPLIADMVDRMERTQGAAINAVAGMTTDAYRDRLEAIGNEQAALEDLKASYRGNAAAQADVQAQIDALTDEIKGLDQAAGTGVFAINDMIQEMADARAEAESLAGEIESLASGFEDNAKDLARQYQREDEDLLRQRQRDIEDAWQGHYDDLADMDDDYRDSLADAEEDFRDAEVQALEDNAEAETDLRKKFDEDKLKAQEDLQKKLAQIEKDYQDARLEAIGNRDALALYEAGKARDKAAEEAKAGFAEQFSQAALDEQLADLREQQAKEKAQRLEDYQDRLKEMEADLAKQKERRRRDFEEQLVEAEEDRRVARERQLEDRRIAEEERRRDFEDQMTDLKQDLEEQRRLADQYATKIADAQASGYSRTLTSASQWAVDFPNAVATGLQKALMQAQQILTSPIPTGVDYDKLTKYKATSYTAGGYLPNGSNGVTVLGSYTQTQPLKVTPTFNITATDKKVIAKQVMDSLDGVLKRL